MPFVAPLPLQKKKNFHYYYLKKKKSRIEIEVINLKNVRSKNRFAQICDRKKRPETELRNYLI